MVNQSRRRFLLSGAAFATAAIGSPRAGAAQVVPSASKPQFGSWGFDLDAMDRSVRPGQDFNRYANGAWIDRTPLPSDQPVISLRSQISDTIEARLHEILEAASAAHGTPETLEGKVGAFYRSFLDEERVEALAASPIASDLDAIATAPDRQALAALMGRNVTGFFGTLFAVTIDADLKDAERYAVILSQADLGLPDRDYYIDPSYTTVKDQYREYVASLLRSAGWEDAGAQAEAVVAFETAIARVQWSQVERRDAEKTYNPLLVSDLQAFAPGFAWRRFLAAAGLRRTDRLIVAEKSAFQAIAEAFGSTALPTIKSWLAFTVIDNAAAYLSQPFDRASFEFRYKLLLGQQEQAARWKRAVVAVAGQFSYPPKGASYANMEFGVGQLYVARHFPPEAKSSIERLVANLKAAMRARLEAVDWMAPGTRAEAVRKLDTYLIKVGYPDKPRDYSGLAVRPDDLVGNVRRARAADWRFHLSRLGGPVDRSDWGFAPQTNDAYQGNLHDIVFPAGFLQPPVFDPAADDAVNYGAIGAAIGHEMTHGFDDQGRKIDAAGELRDWWTAADEREFAARAARLGAQFAAYEPVPGARINPDLTMGENIADLGGINIAADAYGRSLAGKAPEVLDGFSGEQRVFLGYAQVWRGKATESYLRQQVATDVHSPREFRINGAVRNVDGWYKAFDVGPADALHLASDDRVRIW